MKQRGRKSSAQLEVVPQDGVVATVERPKAPPELTDAQAEVWQDVVEALPADWFPPETRPLLAMYCRHVGDGQRISQLIEDECGREDFNIKIYDALLKMQEREARSASSLATRMRLTQQATYDKERKKGEGRGVKRPWQEN